MPRFVVPRDLRVLEREPRVLFMLGKLSGTTYPVTRGILIKLPSFLLIFPLKNIHKLQITCWMQGVQN